jgi:hypothetical protein
MPNSTPLRWHRLHIQLPLIAIAILCISPLAQGQLDLSTDGSTNSTSSNGSVTVNLTNSEILQVDEEVGNEVSTAMSAMNQSQTIQTYVAGTSQDLYTEDLQQQNISNSSSSAFGYGMNIQNGNGDSSNVNASISDGTNSSETCPLECENDTVCRVGSPDFANNLHDFDAVIKYNITNSYHCACPEGWTGLTCNQPYVSCNDAQHICLNGGQCLNGTFLDDYGNAQYYCDCTTAHVNGLRYAGKYCENPTVDICTAPPYNTTHESASEVISQETFCVNGGSCKTNHFLNMSEPCICLDGFKGQHCEYKEAEKPSCDLECNNHGVCQLGEQHYMKPYDTFLDSGIDLQYCSCPDGYFGTQCEYKGRLCGDKHCFNGGACVELEQADGTTIFSCDCSTAFDDENSYAGEFCEAESTSFCSRMPDHNGQQFCVNGGSCKGDSYVIFFEMFQDFYIRFDLLACFLEFTLN